MIKSNTHFFLQVAAILAVEQVFQEWDIKQTDKLLEKLETVKSNRQEEERKLREAESNRLLVESVLDLTGLSLMTKYGILALQ